MTTRRNFVSGCLAASLTPSFAFAAANGNTSDFDMKQYLNELKELVSIDSKSGHVEGANKIADILEKRFKSIGWTVTTRDCAGRGKALIATNTPNQDHYDVVLSVHSDTVQPVGNANHCRSVLFFLCPLRTCSSLMTGDLFGNSNTQDGCEFQKF